MCLSSVQYSVRSLSEARNLNYATVVSAFIYKNDVVHEFVDG